MVKLRNIMDLDVLTLKKEDKAIKALDLVLKKPHSCVVVLDGKRPVGIITESDLVKGLMSKKLKKTTLASSFMTHPIDTLNQSLSLEEAKAITDKVGLRIYPVVDTGKLVGIVTLNDIVHSVNKNITFYRKLQDIVIILFLAFEFFVFIFYEPFMKLIGL